MASGVAHHFSARRTQIQKLVLGIDWIRCERQAEKPEEAPEFMSINYMITPKRQKRDIQFF